MEAEALLDLLNGAGNIFFLRASTAAWAFAGGCCRKIEFVLSQYLFVPFYETAACCYLDIDVLLISVGKYHLCSLHLHVNENQCDACTAKQFHTNAM